MDIASFASIALSIGVKSQAEMDAVWEIVQTYNDPTTPSEAVEAVIRAYTEVTVPPVIIDESIEE